MSAVPGFDEAEWPIARLAKARGRQPAFLEPAEVMAADRLRADVGWARMIPSIGQRWDGQPRRERAERGAIDLTDAAIDARARVDAALGAAGPELAGLLLDVCCFLKGLETVEYERGWPVRSAKLVLKLGLSVLVRHYGFERRGQGREGAIRFWGVPDYKPTMRARESGG